MATSSRQVIEAYILNAIVAGKKPSLAEFVEEELEHVVANTNIGDDFYNDWTSRFKNVAKDLGERVQPSSPDWTKLCVALVNNSINKKRGQFRSNPSTSVASHRLEDSSSPYPDQHASAASTSAGSQTSASTTSTLGTADCQWVEQTYKSLDDDQKWWLGSDGSGQGRKSVEDQMLNGINTIALSSPVHSLIMDPRDDVWDHPDFFSPAELAELISFNRPTLPDLPQELQQYLYSYSGKLERITSVNGIFQTDLASLLEHRRQIDFDPLSQSDLYWARKSIVGAMDLLLYDTIPTGGHSEVDLLHDVWGFIKTCFAMSTINVNSGETSMLSSSIRINHARVSGSGELTRNVVERKVNLRFSCLQYEYGCAEVGLSDGPMNTKAINEERLKLPRTLKDIFVRLAMAVPASIRKIKVCGFHISGMQLTVYIMDSPAGAVCRVTKVGPYEFPRSEKQFAKKMIPLLALVWQVRKIMENSADVVDMDTTIIMPSTEEPAEFHIPPSTELQARENARNAHLRRETLEELQDMMHRTSPSLLDFRDVAMIIRAENTPDPRRYNRPNVAEIGMFIVDNPCHEDTGNRDIVIRTRNNELQ
ncbi:hypothetical protein BX666DRAFT_2118233 [Dichotomocladium elegans]|nr:hypothetical protein BX666DRAFT_2118233 [Dichotomocladium elegans]